MLTRLHPAKVFAEQALETAADFLVSVADPPAIAATLNRLDPNAIFHVITSLPPHILLSVLLDPGLLPRTRGESILHVPEGRRSEMFKSLASSLDIMHFAAAVAEIPTERAAILLLGIPPSKVGDVYKALRGSHSVEVVKRLWTSVKEAQTAAQEASPLQLPPTSTSVQPSPSHPTPVPPASSTQLRHSPPPIPAVRGPSSSSPALLLPGVPRPARNTPPPHVSAPRKPTPRDVETVQIQATVEGLADSDDDGTIKARAKREGKRQVVDEPDSADSDEETNKARAKREGKQKAIEEPDLADSNDEETINARAKREGKRKAVEVPDSADDDVDDVHVPADVSRVIEAARIAEEARLAAITGDAESEERKWLADIPTALNKKMVKDLGLENVVDKSPLWTGPFMTRWMKQEREAGKFSFF